MEWRRFALLASWGRAIQSGQRDDRYVPRPLGAQRSVHQDTSRPGGRGWKLWQLRAQRFLQGLPRGNAPADGQMARRRSRLPDFQSLRFSSSSASGGDRLGRLSWFDVALKNGWDAVSPMRYHFVKSYS